MKQTNRRQFLYQLSIAGAGISALSFQKGTIKEKKIGIIGLDTGHSEMFTKDINEGILKHRGYRVVAAYPHGSKDIPSALKMKPDIIKAVQNMGVEIVDSIDKLLKIVDFVLLESNDGRVHLDQAKKVIAAKKTLFIDKPLAENLKGAEEIFKLAEKHHVPVFSSSALRFDSNVRKVRGGSIGNVLGADIYTYAELEPNHLDLAWYMIHGVEMLYAVMGTGCKEVYRIHQQGYDKVVGLWHDGRIGSVRGMRWGKTNIAGTAFGEDGIAELGPFSGYQPLVAEILTFFDTGKPPVEAKETLEMFRFMEAADKSKLSGRAASLENT